MKMLLARACLIALVMIVAVRLYGDPYTLYMTSDEPFRPAPAWRTLVILLEFGIFACYSYFIWNKRDAAATVAISLATLIDLGLNILLVRLHGVGRFLGSFGTEEYLSTYLASTALRVIVLVFTVVLAAHIYTAPEEPDSAAPA